MALADRLNIDGTDYEIVPEIAPLFSTSKSYAAGDSVIKDAKLYRFTSAHAAGAWTGNDATEIVVGDELTGIREDLNLLEDATVEKTVEPETSDVDLTIHDGFLGKNGNIYHNDNYDKYGYTDIIPVEAGDIITIYNGTSQIPNFYVVCQYANEVFISGSENVTVPFTVPDGTDGIAVTMYQNQKSAYRMTLTRDVDVYTPILEDRVVALETAIEDKADQDQVDELVDEVDALTNDLNLKPNKTLFQKCELVEIETSANKWNKDSAQTGIVHTNGVIYTGGAYNDYKYNDAIPVQEGDTIYFFYKNNYTNKIEARKASRIACYDSDDNVVSSAGVEEVNTFVVPNGIKSVIITVFGTANDTFMVILNDSTVPSEVIPYYEANTYYVATDEFIPEAIIDSAVAEAVSDIEDEITGKIDKDGIEQVTAKNCEFIQIAPNLFDKTAVEIGIVNKGTGALLPNYTNYRTSDWIEVKGSTDYTFSPSGVSGLYWCWYDTSKTYISGGEGSITAEPTKQSPQNAGYIRFSLTNNSLNSDIQLEEGDSATSYREYGSGYIKKEYIPPSNTEEFILNLPKKINAVVGVEMNVYFDNIVEGHDIDYDWNVDCSSGSVGMQMERGYRIVALEAGTYSLTFTATRKYDKSTVSKTTTLTVVAADSEIDETVSVIVIGDSTTDGGTVMRKLHDNFASDTMNVATLGTRGTSPYNHEGRSGWRFSLYFTRAANDGGTVLNPFYNPTTETFDANYYFTNSGVQKPDYFIINLGINDMFGSTNDTQLDSNIVQAINYCDSMIESVQSASPSTKVCVCLTIPPNYSQDAFGKEYKIGQTQHRYKRNNLLWVKRLMEEYENKESEGIYVMPINLCLDTRYNMGFETIPVNSRNTDITYQSPIGNGGVHPVTSGYWQIADVFTAFLKANA